MTALPSKADLSRRPRSVGFVPEADIKTSCVTQPSVASAIDPRKVVRRLWHIDLPIQMRGNSTKGISTDRVMAVTVLIAACVASAAAVV
jgi:hypothetical protein